MSLHPQENKTGLKRALSMPFAYNLVQLLAGAPMYRRRMVRDHIKPFPGCRILDIGCGTGEYVDFLDRSCPDYDYYGFDAEAHYILAAKSRYADRSRVHFRHEVLTESGATALGQFDIVMAMGVMHHMDDAHVLALLRLARLALKPGGRLLTYDPGHFDDINFIEDFFYRHDRGRNIRSPAGYDQLIVQVFPERACFTPNLTYYPCRNVVFVCQAG